MTVDAPPLGARTYEHALVELAEHDERIVVMTAENRAMLRGMPGRLGPRFVDTGISEQTLVGAAAGLALRGRVPVVHALAAFLTMRAFEFARTDVGIADLPVKLVGFVAGFLSDGNGPTHQAIEDVSIMRGIPGMRVFCPSDRVELVSALPAIVADPHPWYVRYIDRPPLAPSPPFGIGRARRLRAGDDVTILTYGLLTEQVLSAAAILAERGVEATVVDVRTLDPIDTEAVLDALAAPLCVTVEDHFLTGGLATIAAEVALRHRITGHHLPVALDDRWYTATLLPRVLEAEGFTAQALAERITAALDSTA